MRIFRSYAFARPASLVRLAMIGMLLPQLTVSAGAQAPAETQVQTVEAGPVTFDDPGLREVNHQAVEEVNDGIRTTASAAWWGVDPLDATMALQAAIDSGAQRVLVPNMGHDWIVEPIALASDQEIIFENGVVVTAKPGTFKGKVDNLFSARGKKNITLRGYGATFRMQKPDYTTKDYTTSEWRHTLGLFGSSNICIEGLTLKESGGDGIYIGAGGEGANMIAYPLPPNLPLYCTDVYINNVVCDNNHRQGISVTGAENLLIENTRLTNTSGTLPEAGTDFEPNNPAGRMVNIVMRNCTITNNKRTGIVFHFNQMDFENSSPVSITISSTRIHGSPLAIYFSSDLMAEDAPRGRIVFHNDNKIDMSKARIGIPPGGDHTITLDSMENIRRVQQMTPHLDLQFNVPAPANTCPALNP